ncbi:MULTISPECIES: Lon protease family protein [unclassified Prosthecochloris]|uniref:Lon protease family protein n=1 Tax=unclassified Prosthecochloris TaxID=2632826 RepID=UPI00223D8ADA|nr:MULTISPECIES: ATP-binding protein [unclassified Prosthecochloris]UZJ37244.1 AAA family ATPase [Prosthecochloris sp. SCSIO W1103]
MPIPSPLSPEKLYRQCDPSSFSFASTQDLDGKIKISGQERAREAIRFGVGMKHNGFNIFALGPTGTGKQTTLEQYLRDTASRKTVPDDWCYVYDFDNMRQPLAISMPAGKACTFRRDMENLIEGLLTVIPGAFSSEEYQEQEKNIKEQLNERQASEIETLEKKAAEKNIALIRTPSGFAFAPVKKGEVLNAEEFMRLKDEEKEIIEKEIGLLKESMQSIMLQVPKWQRETQEKIKDLNQQITSFAVKPLFAELKAKYEDHKAIKKYFDAVEKDVIENFSQFLEKESPVPQMLLPPGQGKNTGSKSFNQYRVNVVVNNKRTKGAPVIYEDKPSIQNLVGDIEHLAQMGTLVTDFTLIKPGALHRANGGYLILDARRLLLEPLAYEALKKAIRTRQIRIESLAQLYGMASTVSLDPQPIPLQTKIILLGERWLYYLLSARDPDFNELFKVAADFDDEMERNQDNHLSYAGFISSIVNREKLKHLDRHAVARMIEYGSRLSGDSDKLSTHIQSITDLVNESDYYATENNHDLITRDDVQQAIDARRYRAGRIPGKIQDAILQNTILIDTESEKVGQINGLSVYMLGNQSFGKPSRITTRIKMGKGEVIDIEREVEMGGPIHSKGVMILSGFLGGRFGGEQPLSLSATLVFEQSYGGIEGDSASSAELYALLSAISGKPIKQCFAVTGSVNQYGEIQAIGGVNEKIEGFFDLCLERGLSGNQGVLIPASNVRNLMLRDDVVDAVKQRNFVIYPVTHIDEGIEILTGIPAGKQLEDGNYPKETINGLAVERLTSMAEKQKKYTEGTNNKNPNES